MMTIKMEIKDWKIKINWRKVRMKYLRRSPQASGQRDHWAIAHDHFQNFDGSSQAMARVQPKNPLLFESGSTTGVALIIKTEVVHNPRTSWETIGSPGVGVIQRGQTTQELEKHLAASHQVPGSHFTALLPVLVPERKRHIRIPPPGVQIPPAKAKIKSI